MGIPPAFISLLTDFGDRDEYVGVMKGAILSRVPRGAIVDICHHIAPHDIRQAAAMILAVYRYFPEGTLHVMVVDPGVGSERDIVYARARSCGFLCPDNGLLSGLQSEGVLQEVWRVTNRALFAAAVSDTFHGRDIIAPVAGFLASGGRPELLGPPMATRDLVCLEALAPRLATDGSLQGIVVNVDRFGNVVTNIGRELLTSFLEGDLKQSLTINLAGRHPIPLVTTYSDIPAGKLLALIGSRDTLELAVNQGSAVSMLSVAPGAPVRVICLR